MRGAFDDRTPEQLPSRPRRDNVGYSWSEVGKHSTLDDAWIVVNSFVYDITNLVRHYPGWALAGETSPTIVALMRKLGKDCTDELVSIYSRSAKSQLEDYVIGYVDRKLDSATSGSHKFARCLVRILEFLPAVQDILRLSSASQECHQDLSSWMCRPRQEQLAHFWCPLTMKCCAPPAPARDQGNTVVRGVQYQQTAVLLGPRLFGSGRIVPTFVEIILRSYRAPGCFSFGVVPENEFLIDPQGSRRFAYTFDCSGRLLTPGDRRGEQTKRLFGERLAEGDHLGLEILQYPSEIKSKRVQCSFTVNGRDLGTAFVIDADQAYLPVLYFNPMQNTSAVEIALPKYACLTEVQKEQAPRGLLFNELGPDLTSWLEVAVDADAWELLTVYGAKTILARRLAQAGPCAVQASQVTILVDGTHIDDDAVKLKERITYKDGIHLQKLHWLTC
eukprot:TRINITY_DN26553_c0_g2_i1.p1 TRINITY_DN26553_c0_g2~~TRINITY_DN26553_c0_g2_i1.p1  ORF type:complete len:446 (+),score=20.31 TRINITY_DN26553_c0_g2_i1:121-1458(+)